MQHNFKIFLHSYLETSSEQNNMFWGLSEAIDLVEEYLANLTKVNPNPPAELNVLLFGSGDPRHIIKSLAKIRIKKNKNNDGVIKINFYVLEGCLEILARYMLLLNIALEPKVKLSVKAKTHLFMDLYGNSLLRPSSYNYLCSKGRVYMDLITDLDGQCHEKFSILDLNALKYGERDSMLNVFSFWQNNLKHKFDITTYWEQRVRSYLESRYDSRNGAFDWDLSMRLRDNGIERVCAQEYKHWRDCGVAFVFPEYEQTMPNKTLAAAVLRCGDRIQHRGYLGDITTGPFVTFGEKCSDPTMCKSSHGVNTYRSTDLTERNVFQLMFEIQECREYEFNLKDTRQFGGTSLQLSKHMSSTPSLLNHMEGLHSFDEPAVTVDNIKVTFLSIEDVLNISNRDRFKNFFDVIYVGFNYFAFLKGDFRNILRDTAMVVFETKQNQVLGKEIIAEFLVKIKEFSARMDLTAITNFNINLPLPLVLYKQVKKQSK